MASPAAAGRGGERNFAKPDVDQEHLLDVLKKYVKHAGVGASFNFEPYGTLSKSSAVQAKGLSKAFKYNPLKDCLRLVIKDYPDLKHQVPLAKQDAWPGDTAEMLLNRATTPGSRRLAARRRNSRSRILKLSGRSFLRRGWAPRPRRPPGLSSLQGQPGLSNLQGQES